MGAGSIPYEDAIKNADELVRAAEFDPRRVSGPVRTVYLITQLEFELTSGGVLQWLTNRSGRYARETAQAFDDVGATRSAQIVREILAVVPGGALPDDDVSRASLVQALHRTTAATWRTLGDDMLEWPDDIDTLLRRYVELNNAEFEKACP